jgi:hypothetical protein
MKLYTEEQVNTMLNRARLHKQDDTEMFTNEYLLSQETPIELPSDEDIDKQAFQVPYDGTDTFYDKSFINGAKWMKQHILNQNK